MAFKIAYMRSGEQPTYEKKEIAESKTFSAGTLLAFSSGALDVVGASGDPEYILLEDVADTVSGQLVYVQPISREAVYEASCSAAMTSVGLGATVTTKDGVQVTATAITATETGAYGATVVAYPNGKEKDKLVHVAFTGKPAIAAYTAG